MKDIIENLGSLAPILTAVFGVSIMSLILAIVTSLSYDSFDMRLLPRDKFALIKIKQSLGAFLFIIPVFCLIAFLLALQAKKSTVFFLILFIIFFINAICMILGQIVYFMEFITNKTENQERFKWINKVLVKFTSIYKMNNKMKLFVTLIFLILSQTLIAYSYVEKNFDSITSSLTKYLLLMFGVGTIIISSLLSEKEFVDYVFIAEFQNSAKLKEEIGKDNDLLLEYFLSETIGIFSTKNKEYKVIKRIIGSESTYEVYKSTAPKKKKNQIEESKSAAN